MIGSRKEDKRIAENRNKYLNMKNKNYYNSEMTIIEYNNANDITVKFDNGYEIKTRYSEFKNSCVKNPYDRSVYNVGYLGEGIYEASYNKKPTLVYDIWVGMIRRCYNLEYKQKHPTYTDCTVCQNWLNFQNFAKWFTENYYVIDNCNMQLDKDILIKGNKIYSPETCCFVPQDINKLFTKTDKNRGEYPIGVYLEKKQNKFKAQCCTMIKRINIGRFKTVNDAFNAYKKFKENYIKQIANEYKNKIPEKLYNALINYEVEITD